MIDPSPPPRDDAATPGWIRSPCVSVCRMDVATGYCEGCFRTIDEIANWASMSDAARRQTWTQLRARGEQVAAALGFAPVALTPPPGRDG